MALYLKLKPQHHQQTKLRSLRLFCSNRPPCNSIDTDNPQISSSAAPPPRPSSFSDIKERLKSPPPSPPRNPSNPPSPSSLDDIRKHLSLFRSKSPANHPPPSAPTISFEELLKTNVLNRNPNGGGGLGEEPAGKKVPFDAIRQSLRNFRQSATGQTTPSGGRNAPGFLGLKGFQNSMQPQNAELGTKLRVIGGGPLPESIFGPELNKQKAEGDKDLKKKISMKMYNYDDLGKKLRMLRPKGDGDWFSLEELNERLGKLIEMDEKENESKAGSSIHEFKELRQSLVALQYSDSKEVVKRNNLQRLSILSNLGMSVTPTFMLNPPQEQLLERYFHPDHMSSEEKMKVELQKVRDEFKMHENDCGSARVQVAQLTTKIKHLSSVLHKKDKHSRKGLQEMVQTRKKLLKYLRRTDWESYCLVLSRLGLRDVPEYKAPDYKTKKPDSKTKKKIKA